LFTSMTVADNLQLGSYRFRRESPGQRTADLEAVYALFPRLQERRTQLAGTTIWRRTPDACDRPRLDVSSEAAHAR
jgi:hypothetical protein